MSSRSLRAAVAEAIGEFTGHPVDGISDGDDLAEDLGVDSMSAVSLLIAVEDRFGVMLPEGCEGRLVGIRTVGQLVEQLAAIYRVSSDDPEAAGRLAPGDDPPGASRQS
jgi:acyl carrier protein